MQRSSQKCNAQSIEDTVRHCWYAPLTPGGFHVVLVDEADQMTNAAQLALLSKLDSTDPAPNTIWIFTANDTERLERRFLSRCKVLDFSGYDLAGEIAAYLDTVWHLEGGNRRRTVLERTTDRTTPSTHGQHSPSADRWLLLSSRRIH
jgi:DNA polymerase III delta prime subunit